MTQPGDDYEDIEWSSYADVVLLNSLAGLRPVGANYHFCMTAVWQRFCSAMAKNVSLDSIEKRLSNFYNFEATNGIIDENGLFTSEQEFSLPESEFPEVATISKERETSSRKSKTSSAADPKTPASKTAKKPEPKTSEKPKRSAPEEEKRTPAPKRGRGSVKTTPTPRRGRN